MAGNTEAWNYGKQEAARILLARQNYENLETSEEKDPNLGRYSE